MKTVFLIVGLIVLAMGILFAGQGLGYIHWPATSTMIDQTKWAYYGGCIAVVGLVVIWYSRR
jgi:hypothetical protein